MAAQAAEVACSVQVVKTASPKWRAARAAAQAVLAAWDAAGPAQVADTAGAHMEDIVAQVLAVVPVAAASQERGSAAHNRCNRSLAHIQRTLHQVHRRHNRRRSRTNTFRRRGQPVCAVSLLERSDEGAALRWAVNWRDASVHPIRWRRCCLWCCAAAAAGCRQPSRPWGGDEANLARMTCAQPWRPPRGDLSEYYRYLTSSTSSHRVTGASLMLRSVGFHFFSPGIQYIRTRTAVGTVGRVQSGAVGQSRGSPLPSQTEYEQSPRGLSGIKGCT